MKIAPTLQELSEEERVLRKVLDDATTAWPSDSELTRRAFHTC